VVRLLLSLAAVAVVWTWLDLRGRPERVLDPVPPGLEIHGRWLCAQPWTGDPHGALLRVKPIEGGEWRPIGSPGRGGGPASVRLITDDALYYVQPESPQPGIATANGVPRFFPGGSRRPAAAQPVPGPPRERLFRASLDGGAVADITPRDGPRSQAQPGLFSLTAIGDTLYWTRARLTGAVVRHIRARSIGVVAMAGRSGDSAGSGRRVTSLPDRVVSIEVNRYRTDVLAMPAVGGHWSCVCSVDDSSLSAPSASDTTLYWLDRAIGGEDRATLYSLREGEHRVRVYHGFDGSDVPCEVGGRIYWLSGPAAITGMGAGLDRSRKLVCANPDGSARRIVAPADLDGNGLRTIVSLQARDGKLYAVVRVLTPRRQATGVVPGSPGMDEEVCRVRPGSARLMEPLCRVPVGSVLSFAGRYLYYSVWEDREQWLDWSSSGVALKNVNVLYRRRLPD
jgi:hypothetical protein